MKIVVLGAGAMGMLFGSYLSQNNDVTLIDVDSAKVERIRQAGIRILEADGSEQTYYPEVAQRLFPIKPVDLIIIFVKAMFSRDALASNQDLIGPDTYVLTLQNGSGHEEILQEFVSLEHILIGTTQHNSSIQAPGAIYHGGGGITSIGCPESNSPEVQRIAENFQGCGLKTEVSGNVQKLIWKKLFLNTSASALTAVLQVNLGYIIDNPHAWQLAQQLVREAVEVANADGMDFDAEVVVHEIRTILQRARDGYTSIYADIRDGRKSEVDTISGSVVRAGRRNGIPTPVHEIIICLIHALEERKK